MGVSTGSLSGSISFDGLGSGTKFNDMIGELKKIEEIPRNRLVTWKADWKTRYDAFDTLYKNVQTLSTSFRSMGNINNLLQKKVSSSTSGVASATADAAAITGSHTFDVKQLATNAVVTNKTLFAKDTKITEAGVDGVFGYAYKDDKGDYKSFTLNIPADSTIDDLVTKINSDPQNPGVKASLIKSGKEYMFQLQRTDTGADAELFVSNLTTLPKFASNTTYAQSGSLGPEGPGTGKETIINTTTDNAYYSFNFSDPKTGELKNLKMEVKPDDTVEDLKESINGSSGATGIKADIILDGDGNYHLYLESTSGKAIEIVDGEPPVTESSLLAENSGYKLSDWTERKSQDAEYTVDGINDVVLHSASNKLTDIFEGMTVNLEGVGKTTLTTSTSTENLKGKIEEMVKGLNELLAKIKELTAVDENKSLTDRTQDKNQYASQYSAQMGSTLTGNYGVQLLTTQLKSTISGQSIGFRSQEKVGDPYGDLFTSLSSIGIIMDSDAKSSTYGQLRFLTEDETKKTVKKSDVGLDGKEDETTEVILYRTLDQALKEDSVAVADLLAGSGAKSDNANFVCSNYIKGITKPGNYNVTYDVVDGKATNVMIGGVAAKLDSENGQVFVAESGKAVGLQITIDNVTDGSYEGDVRVKQGKITQLADFFSDQMAIDELKPDDKGNFSSDLKRGSLVILKDNYLKIMNNIEDKIVRETERIDRWEKQQRLKFARLDTLLGSYNNQMSANAASLKSLEGGSSE